MKLKYLFYSPNLIISQSVTKKKKKIEKLLEENLQQKILKK